MLEVAVSSRYISARVAALAHPELADVYSVPGLWHLMDYGGMKLIYKMYFHSLLKYCGHDVLHRTGITLSADLYFPTSELFYHVWDALFMLAFNAYERSPAFVATSPDACVDGFIGWYRECWDSGDVPQSPSAASLPLGTLWFGPPAILFLPSDRV